MTRAAGLIALAAAGAAGCHPRSRPVDDDPPPPAVHVQLERVDRCSVRVLPAPQAQRDAFLAYAHDALHDLTVMSLTPTRYGDRLARLVVADAPSPPNAPSLPEQAVALGRAALVRYRRLFGPLADAVGTADLHAARDGVGAWSVDGSVADGDRHAAIRVELKPSGALHSLVVRDTEPRLPAGVPCAAPAIALDDPRIRAAVVGQRVTSTDLAGRTAPVTFAAGDVGAIATEVRETEPGLFRRVITVDLQRGRWTALLDADTAALVTIVQRFQT
ncbi:MAG TPA: hypothetical protein VHE35_04960 [Kofleriaceae bacterium]|nr:hypothetical protein [Kofleriaceae bacterium]